MAPMVLALQLPTQRRQSCYGVMFGCMFWLQLARHAVLFDCTCRSCKSESVQGVAEACHGRCLQQHQNLIDCMDRASKTSGSSLHLDRDMVPSVNCSMLPGYLCRANGIIQQLVPVIIELRKAYCSVNFCQLITWHTHTSTQACG